VFYRIEGCARREVLADVVAHLRLPEEVDRTAPEHALIARENLASTGIARPYIHNPGLLTLTRSTVTLCFLGNAVDLHIPGRPRHP
jgi:PTS system nitrogen regulatory IIA component